MTWIVIKNTNEGGDKSLRRCGLASKVIESPKATATQWPWAVVKDDMWVKANELNDARDWCDENNIPRRNTYAGMYLKSQDCVTAFMLRWG